MKLVDEKGKLFGKINIIDLLVLVVIILALGFAALRLRGGEAANPVTNLTKLTYTVKVGPLDDNTYREVLRQLEATKGEDGKYHDQLMADGAPQDGYITGLVAEPHKTYETDSEGQIVPSVEDPYQGGRWDLIFTVEANVPSTVTNKVGTQEVRVGKSHILKTTHIEFQYSTIQTCDWG